MSLATALILAAGMPFADLDAVDRAAAGFAGAPVGAEGGPAAPVDRRLRLNPCSSTLAAAWFNPRQETIIVQCPDAGGWRVYVPVRRSAAAQELAAISRGDAVTIAVEGDGFSVSQPGEALDGGAVGAWIRVRRASASATAQADTLRGRVVRPGLVQLELP
jgi:flagella basal body P-ring formation protein FlgA